MSGRAARALLVVAFVLLPLPVRAQQPDWTPIEYPDGAGCGLHVQFFTADGAEPSVNGKPTAFFPGGAPPSTSASVTQVRGTCYLRKNALGTSRVIDVS